MFSRRPAQSRFSKYSGKSCRSLGLIQRGDRCPIFNAEDDPMAARGELLCDAGGEASPPVKWKIFRSLFSYLYTPLT